MEKSYNQDLKNVEFEKDSKDIKKDSAYYDAAREQAMQDYLADVGPISQFINQHMDQISKEKNSGIEK